MQEWKSTQTRPTAKAQLALGLVQQSSGDPQLGTQMQGLEKRRETLLGPQGLLHPELTLPPAPSVVWQGEGHGREEAKEKASLVQATITAPARGAEMSPTSPPSCSSLKLSRASENQSRPRGAPVPEASPSLSGFALSPLPGEGLPLVDLRAPPHPLRPSPHTAPPVRGPLGLPPLCSLSSSRHFLPRERASLSEIHIYLLVCGFNCR